MISLTNFSLPATFLCAAFLCGAARLADAAPEAVLAPVVEVKGSVSLTGGGMARSANLRAGGTLAEGSTITAAPESRVLFSPVPGVTVSGHAESTVSLVRMAVAKSGGAVQSRDVRLGLAAGTLSFSTDKRTSSTTTFAVETLRGTLSAQGAVGSVAIDGSCVHVASLSGKMAFKPTGSAGAISIPPGSYVTICAEGATVRILMVNVVASTVTEYNSDGVQVASRAAEAQDLESARGLFEVTLGHVVSVVGYGLLGAESVAEITTTLTTINQVFAAAGLAPVEATAVGTSTPVARTDSESATTPTLSSGSANPANTSGQVISRER